MQSTIGSQLVRVAIAGLVFCGFASAGQTLGQDQTQAHCSVESKNQYYRDFEASYEGDKRNQDEALNAAKNYLACPDDSDQQEVLARLNLAVGRMLNAKGLSGDAIAYFIKAASCNSPVKTSPQTYADLAKSYLDGPYAELSADYEMRFQGKDETRASLLAVRTIFEVVDRIVDAYARAIALTGVEPPKLLQGDGASRDSSDGPAEWMDRLTELYRFRHNGSERGLKEMIGSIVVQPMPTWPIHGIALPPRTRHRRKIRTHSRLV